MKGDFGRSMDQLARNVGDGKLVGVVGYSGPQAVAIHEHPSRHSPASWRRKPRLDFTTPGTGTKFLERPLMASYPRYLQSIADDVLKPGGANRAMRTAMMNLKTQSRVLVPREFGVLRASAVAQVVDNQRVTYRRKGQ